MTRSANRLPFSFSTDAAGLFLLLDGDAGWIGQPAILSTCPADLDEVDVWCEGVVVARVRRAAPGETWTVAALACVGSAHGVHPKFAARSARLATLRSRVGVPPPAACARCDGSGWVAFDSAEALRGRALARAFGIWRGIIDPNPRPASREESLLALEAFLGEPALVGLRVASARLDNNGGTDDGNG
jgi:hypothetical protein